MNPTAAEIEARTSRVPERARTSRREWALWLMRPAVLLRGTVVLTFLIYIRTITFDWVFDDHVQVVLNPWLSTWGSLKQMFTLHSWAFSDYGFAGKFYRPMYLVWLLVNNKLFGGLPGWFHLAGLFLHVAVVILAYLTARRLLKDDRSAAVAALLFALHPGKVEAVAWVAGLTEPLLAVFFFGTVLAYLRWQQDEPRAIRWLWISVACFAGALFSKETAVFAPCLILVHFWQQENKPGLKPVLQLATPYFVVGLGYWIIRLKVMSGIAQLGGKFSIAKTIYTVPMALCWYVQHTLWPFGLSLLYPEMVVRSALTAQFIVPVLVLFAMLAVFIVVARKSSLALLMGLWFVLTILPPVGAVLLVQPHDRYLYIPMFGAAVIGADLIGRLKQKTALAIVGLIAVAFTIGSYRTTSYWEDDLHIFARGMEKAPNNTAARSFYAGALTAAGQKDQAFAVMLEGYRQRPESANISLALAQMYESNGDVSEARKYYEHTLTLEADARFIGMCHYNLGALAEKDGKLDQAELEYRMAIQSAPTAAGYHQRLGILLRERGRQDEARAEFAKEQAIRVTRTRNF
jgi:predicted negative regulator of RcsB-dependent stress response